MLLHELNINGIMYYLFNLILIIIYLLYFNQYHL